MNKQIVTLSATLLLSIFIASSCTKEVALDDNRKDDHIPQAISYTVPSRAVHASLMAHSDKRDCWKGYGDCALAVTGLSYSGEENMLPVLMYLSEDRNRLIIDNQIYKLNEDGNHLNFGMDQLLGESLSSQLGFRSIMIHSGVYPTLFTVNENGRTVVNVTVE